jgi:hypothetical protein
VGKLPPTRSPTTRYTNLNGEYPRIQLGALKIRKITQGHGALQTNDVSGNPRHLNKQRKRGEGLLVLMKIARTLPSSEKPPRLVSKSE